MVPFYPPGFPLHMVLLAALVGWENGPFLVSPLFAAIGLAAFYLLGRELGLTRGEAGAGTLILAFQPVYVFLGLIPMSDTVATTWATLAVLAALRARRDARWAWGAGLAFGIGCLVRPSNVILVPTLALALPLQLGALLRFALGATPGLAFFLAFNHVVHGHALRTAYPAIENEFALGFFRKRFNHYTHWLGRTFTPLVPLAWLGVVASRETRWRDRLLLLVWFASFFAFFCSYRHYDMWWYLRFMMPAFPALIVGALLAGRPVFRAVEFRLHLPSRGLASPNLLPPLLLLFILVSEVGEARRQSVLGIGASDTIYPRACLFAAERLPPRAIVLSFLMSGALEHYTDLMYLRFDTMEDLPTVRRLLRRTMDRGSRWYALVHPLELELFRSRGLGRWRQIGNVDEVLLLELEPESMRRPAS
jgi:4-amino-4-deoxy-L-arabinose transferase-like glycosyltransferase